jgi:hypothetical protein
MQDSELKKLLLETCPVLPGQEARAWATLRTRLNAPKARSESHWLLFPTWRGFAVTAAVIAILFVGGSYFLGQEPMALITADSQSPGIYATAFYSDPAKAQVVWLNGMEPASDKPTYLDPTTVINRGADAPKPANDPNSL